MKRNHKHRSLAAAAMAALLVAGGLAVESFGAKSEGTKKNPKALLKQFDITTVATGFRKPTSADWTPDGTLLVSEKAGQLWAITPEGTRRLVLDIGGHTSKGRERGLGTVEVAHDFATSRRVYLSYTFESNPSKPAGPQAMRVTYITLNPDGSLVNPGSPETVVLGKDATGACPPASNSRDCPPSINATHQGGQVISDKDGTLWVAYGESNLPSTPGKHVFRVFNPASTSGKVLHVDQNGNGLPGHPFCRRDQNLEHTCTKIFARGFRNPFRFTLTPGDDPIVSDVGWNEREEIDIVRAGRNYGWPCFEGKIKTPFYSEMGRCRGLYPRARKAKISGPIYSYPIPAKGAGAAVIVGPFYPGGAYPDRFDGAFFFGDYAQGFIKLLTIGKKGVKVRPIANGVTPVHFNIAPDGNLAFVDFRRGAIRELVYAPANKAPRPVLSASPTSGHGPLTVNFSAVGTTDPDGDAVTYDWDFGDGSAHSSLVSPTHTYTGNGTYIARLRVTDSNGASASATTTITVGNTAPSATILSPTAGMLSRGGQFVTLSATGSDPEQGALGSGAFSWDVTLVHKQHEHPLGEFTGSSTQFQAVRDHDADSLYKVDLRVTDSQGLSTNLPTVIVEPEVVPLKIRSKPRDVKLSYGGREVNTPKRVMAAIGFRANLSAPDTIERGGRTLRFAGWSQGGRRIQIYTIPARRSKVVARYK